MGAVAVEADHRSGAERARSARRLASARRRWFFVAAAIGLLAPLLIWTSGLSAVLWGALSAPPVPGWTSLPAFSFTVLAILALAGLPIAWQSGYQLARRYGLSQQSVRAWLADWLKGALIGCGLGVVALQVFYWLLGSAGPAWWWLYALFSSATLLLLTFVTPFVFVPLFYRMRPLDDAEVVRAIQELSLRARATVREVCTLDFSRKTLEANAAVIGIGASRKVVLADTLLREFTLPEVSSVVAHELGHHVHRDIFRLLLVQSGLTCAGLAAAALGGAPALALLGAAGGLREPSSLPLLILACELAGLLAMPLLKGLSRRSESLADLFALNITADPPAFASALRKLANQNLAEEYPPRWAELLLHSHPAIGRRIAFAEAQARG